MTVCVVDPVVNKAWVMVVPEPLSYPVTAGDDPVAVQEQRAPEKEDESAICTC